MNKFQKLWRHLTMTSLEAQRAFPPETLTEVETIITDGEERHRAEIRVIIEKAFSFFAILKGETSRTRALELFEHYKIHHTEDNTGILVYINMADRKIEILTDTGIDKQINAEAWQTICNEMANQFRKKHFHNGICHALDEMNRLLVMHFPRHGPRENALPDMPVIL